MSDKKQPPQRKPNKYPQTFDEMVESESKRAGNKLYDDGSRKANLAALSSRMHDDLSVEREKIQLVNGDLETIKKKALEYIKSCAAVGVLPSFIGLCRGLGHTRSSLYRFLELHPGTQVAEFLEIVRDSIADMLDTAMLDYNVNTIAAIFILKSIHDRIDRAELRLQPAPPVDPAGPVLSHEEIIAKYLPEGDL